MKCRKCNKKLGEFVEYHDLEEVHSENTYLPIEIKVIQTKEYYCKNCGTITQKILKPVSYKRED